MCVRFDRKLQFSQQTSGRTQHQTYLVLWIDKLINKVNFPVFSEKIYTMFASFGF